jgi:hypothetical protein
MVRPVNQSKTATIPVVLTEKTGWYLDRLVETGLYGPNRPQAAAIVIYDHLKMLIGQGKLAEPPPRAVIEPSD